MIKKIEYIKDFGIYKNFNWNSTSKIKDFNIKNLFYGWNYSGKTTLSRIFSSLSNKTIHESYIKGQFKIHTEDGLFDSSNLQSFPYELLIFNSDYIKENLNFSFHKENLSDSKTILFDVGDSAKYETRIIELKKQIESINGSDTVVGKKTNYLLDIEKFENYDKSNSGKFTILAKEIKDDHFISLINFTKANLKPIISNVKDNLTAFIIKDRKQISSLNDIVKISEPKQELDKIQSDLNYNNIIEKTNRILVKTPDQNLLFKILDNNAIAYSWVKEGQKYNKPNSECLFCGNVVSEDRIKFLNKYFSSQASILKEDVAYLKKEIFEEENRVNDINLPSSLNDFNIGFVNEYKILMKEYDKQIISYRKHLKNIIKQLDTKLNKSLHLSLSVIKPFNIELITDLIDKINQLIIKNNFFSTNFNEKIEEERNRFKNHLVASFLKREKFSIKEKKFKKAVIEIEKLDKKIEAYQKEIDRYESLKESDKEGAEQYNYFIQSFLNRTDIEIKLDEISNKFILLRNNENASNLSEGEKTAIAFSHFLVSIRALESKSKFKDYIVFVDDPISSLDGNHIFQINSLLKETFFKQEPDPNNPKQNMWKINCKQLFISTHNFEFFNLMKELPKSNGYDYIKDERRCKESRYFIERKIDQSFIMPLPSIFDDFKSEYHFLFSEIMSFNDDPNKNSSDRLLSMPNVLRRFVEMYTLTKYPSKEEVDDRANVVFGKLISKRILKPLNYFSHYNNIDRIGKQNELIADLPVACSSLIEFIKEKDKNHFKALNNAII